MSVFFPKGAGAGEIQRASELSPDLAGLFADVAREQGWCPGAELRAYDRYSVFFLLGVAGDPPIGGLQLVLGNPGGMLPCRSVWPELPIAERLDVADVALLALRPDYRGRGELAWLLCVEMWRYCRTRGITELWAEITPANLRRYRRLGFPFEIAGPLRPHWGEDCYPCRMAVQGAADYVVERATAARCADSRFHRVLAHAFRQGDDPQGAASDEACVGATVLAGVGRPVPKA